MEYGVGIEYVFLCFQVLLTVLREIQLFNPGMQSLCDSTCDVVFKTSTPPGGWAMGIMGYQGSRRYHWQSLSRACTEQSCPSLSKFFSRPRRQPLTAATGLAAYSSAPQSGGRGRGATLG